MQIIFWVVPLRMDFELSTKEINQLQPILLGKLEAESDSLFEGLGLLQRLLMNMQTSMIKKPSNALSAQQLYNDINNALNASNAQQLLSVIKNASNASNAQQLYSDIVNCNNPPNTLNTCQEIYSDIKNSSNALHGQQIFSDVRNASKAQQQLLYSDIKNSSKQLQEKRLQKCHFVSALAMCLNLMNMIYVPFLTTQSSLMVKNSDSQII